jgi:hypothetical protein
MASGLDLDLMRPVGGFEVRFTLEWECARGREDVDALEEEMR